MAPEDDDYYGVLGVKRSASQDEIKRSFKEKAKCCHPDLHPGDAHAQENFVQLNRAYDTLHDAMGRKAYDAAHPGPLRHPVPRDGLGDGPSRATAWPTRPAVARVVTVVVPASHTPPVRVKVHGPAIQIARGVPGFGTLVEVACPACRGRGIRGGTACGSCGGRGWLAAGRGGAAGHGEPRRLTGWP